MSSGDAKTTSLPFHVFRNVLPPSMLKALQGLEHQQNKEMLSFWMPLERAHSDSSTSASPAKFRKLEGGAAPTTTAPATATVAETSLMNARGTGSSESNEDQVRKRKRSALEHSSHLATKSIRGLGDYENLHARCPDSLLEDIVLFIFRHVLPRLPRISNLAVSVLVKYSHVLTLWNAGNRILVSQAPTRRPHELPL